MGIRLRIAGIYYDETFNIADLPTVPAISIPGRVSPTGGPTIFELLEAAFLKPGPDKENFIYVFERREDCLSITSLGVTHKKDLVGSLGNRTRGAGTYQLTETVIPGGVAAWQYYVYQDGKSVSQLVPSASTGFSPAKGDGTGFTGFDQFVLTDGDEVIYRQVSILRGPNVPNR